MSVHWGGVGPGHTSRSTSGSGGVAADINALLREDGSFVLREDGSFIIREDPIVTLTAPTLTVFNGSIYTTSATGVVGAPVFQMTIPADLGEGDYVEEEIDTVNTFNSGGLLDEERVLQWDGSAFQLADETTFAPGNFSIDTGLTSATTFYVRRRFRRTYGDTSIYSGWSSTVTITTAAASSAVLNTASGFNKNALLTVSGSPALTISGTSGNGWNFVRSTIEQAFTKAKYEFTISSGSAGRFGIGFDDNSNDLSGSVIPGLTAGGGIDIDFISGAFIQANWNSGGGTFYFANNVAGSTQDADIFAPILDTSAHTMDLRRTRSGATVQIGSTATGLPTLTHYYALGGTVNSTMAGTFNFGGSTYAEAPGSGVASYWA